MDKLQPSSTDADIDAHIDSHLGRYGNAAATLSAEFVEVDLERRLLLIYLSNGRRLVLPLEDIQGLAEAAPEQLKHFEVLGLGQGLDWPGLNVSYPITGLLQGVYGNQGWMRQLRHRGHSAPTAASGQSARRAVGSRRRKTDSIPA